MSETEKQTGLIKAPDLLTRVGISRATLDRWMEKGLFPKPKIQQQGRGCHRWWDLSEVIEWQNNQRT